MCTNRNEAPRIKLRGIKAELRRSRFGDGALQGIRAKANK
jgi:hypothetical protein